MEENVKLCGYTSTTPIQAYCIPAVLQGNDVIGIAQTGEALHMIHPLTSLMLMLFRIRQNSCLSCANHLPLDGQGEEIGQCTPQPNWLQRKHRCCASGASYSRHVS